MSTETETAAGTDRLVGYQCVACGKTYPPDPFEVPCAACGENLDVLYDYDAIRRVWSQDQLANDRDGSLWRYAPLLPVDAPPRNRSIRVGGTPLVALPEKAADLGLAGLYIKDDSRQPSGSLKDRATEVALKHASQLGTEVLVAASTGNAAASLAALAAFHNQRAVILAPASAPVAKLTQILQYGAILYPVDGNYDQAFDLSLQVAEAFGWYSRSTGINPILSEGKKTVALELAEQLQWQVPDKVFVPVGDGCILGGVHKGFADLLRLGWIDHLPELIAVQATGSAAVVNALESGGELAPVQAKTVADSIGVDMPRDGAKALRAVRETGGFGLRVEDRQILKAQLEMSREAGIFAEPAAAAAYAGLLESLSAGRVGHDETVVVLVTGSGLKDIPAARELISVPPAMAANLENFRAYYEQVRNEE